MALTTATAEAEFLQSSWARQHAFLAVLDLVDAGRAAPPPDVLAKLNRDFSAMPPARFVEAWYGVRAAGLKRVLDKLGADRPKARGAYRKLVQMLAEDGHGATVLRHLEPLNFTRVARLAAAPDWMRTPETTWMDLHLIQQLAAIGEALLARGDMATPKDFHAFVGSMNFATSPLRAFIRHGVYFVFPAPPWPGDTQLWPVRDTRELAQVSERFRNCVLDDAEKCIAGTSFYYVWEGAQPAVVELCNRGGLCWSINHVLGYRNHAMAEADHDLITARFPLEALNSALWMQSVRWRAPE